MGSSNQFPISNCEASEANHATFSYTFNSNLLKLGNIGGVKANGCSVDKCASEYLDYEQLRVKSDCSHGSTEVGDELATDAELEDCAEVEKHLHAVA